MHPYLLTVTSRRAEMLEAMQRTSRTKSGATELSYPTAIPGVQPYLWVSRESSHLPKESLDVTIVSENQSGS